MLAEKLYEQPAEYAEGWNFGPETDQAATVGQVADRIVEIYGRGSVEKAVDAKAPHEAKLLTLDITKAKERLGWRPMLSLEETLRWTAEWYRDYRSRDAWEIGQEQVRRYIRGE